MFLRTLSYGVMKGSHHSFRGGREMTNQLDNVKIGLGLAILALLMNIGLGVLFGINESMFQEYIKAGIEAHPELFRPTSQEGIWRLVQRAHFHAGGIGAFTLGLVIVTALSNMSALRKQLTATLLGLSIFYPMAWYVMFFQAPIIGTRAAHSHWLVEYCTYIGVGSLAIGLLSLIAGVFLTSKKHSAPA